MCCFCFFWACTHAGMDSSPFYRVVSFLFNLSVTHRWFVTHPYNPVLPPSVAKVYFSPAVLHSCCRRLGLVRPCVFRVIAVLICVLPPTVSLVEQLSMALLPQDEALKASVCYVFHRVWACVGTAQALPPALKDRVCIQVLNTLHHACSPQLTINCLGKEAGGGISWVPIHWLLPLKDAVNMAFVRHVLLKIRTRNLGIGWVTNEPSAGSFMA